MTYPFYKDGALWSEDVEFPSHIPSLEKIDRLGWLEYEDICVHLRRVYSTKFEEFASKNPTFNINGIASQFSRLIDPREISLLMEGTTNLINYVIEQHQNGTPVDTLVFLDKSNRNGGFLFNTMWDLLEEAGELPNLVRPTPLYLNIGSMDDHKVADATACALARQALGPRLSSVSNVTIVDEYVESGNTARRALGFWKSLTGTDANFLAQFKDLPVWYDSDAYGLNGVQGAYQKTTLISKDYVAVRGISVSVGLSLQRELWEKGEEAFKEDFEACFSVDPPKFSLATSGDLTPMQQLRCQFPLMSAGESETILKYIKYAGGLFSSNLKEAEKNSIFNFYRGILSDMTRLYMEGLERQKTRPTEPASASQYE